ncbi:L-lactate dehydrogenase (cytochrome), partial [Tremellales sp. Uapishka_1]
MSSAPPPRSAPPPPPEDEEEEQGASANERLLAAAKSDNEDLMDSAFEELEDVNYADGLGNTGKGCSKAIQRISSLTSSCFRLIALHYAVINASTTVLDPILCHDTCDVDLKNRQGDTPLHIAVRQKFEQHDGLRLYLGKFCFLSPPYYLTDCASSIVQSLLEAGADTLIRNSRSLKPIDLLPFAPSSDAESDDEKIALSLAGWYYFTPVIHLKSLDDPAPEAQQATGRGLIPFSEVQKHASADDCWVIIDGRIYDLTEFAADHPGGAQHIHRAAGRDATEVYKPLHPPGTIENGLDEDKFVGLVDTTTLPVVVKKSPREDAEAKDRRIDLAEIIGLPDFEPAAKINLTGKAWAYMASGATDQYTLGLNRSAYNSILFRPRILVDVDVVDTSTTMMGEKTSLPIFVAPAGMAMLSHPEGEALLAKAAGACDIIQMISTNASAPLPTIIGSATRPDQPFFMQLYVDRNRAKSEALVEKINGLGLKAIFVTVDAAAPGKREADERSRAEASGISGGKISSDTKGGGIGRSVGGFIDPSLSWKDIAWLRKHTNLPIGLKGVQTVEDALRGAEMGVDAIYLSNHGGRALDGTPPALYTLMEINKFCPEVFAKCEHSIPLRPPTPHPSSSVLFATAQMTSQPTPSEFSGNTLSVPTTPHLRAESPYSVARFKPDHPLYEDLAPADSYVNGVYWADLPAKERRKWINEQTSTETIREWLYVWRMFKADPLSPTRAYFSTYVMSGFGLFTEGYTLFSIGNLKALYQAVWPTCWSTYKVCTKNWVAAVDYLQIVGIIIGQITVGIEGDWIGRKFGLVQDALVMTIGLLLLTGSWGVSLQGWVICYGFSQMVYGFGVGGEYPMTSTTALESKPVDIASQTDDKLHRGRNVVLAFLMQGWGQLFNQVLLIILLLIFNHHGDTPYSERAAQATFRVSFAIMALMTLWLAYHRYYRATYSSAALRRSKKGAHVNQSGYDITSLKLVATHFGGRLVGTTSAWFFNDFLFYGNKLFASTFIKVINPNATGVLDTWLWNLVNIAVALVGYYMAALLIDHKRYGRKRMQIIGFLADGILYLICAIWYKELKTAKHIKGFQTIYYLSSFFQQFGPNCTTFLVAAEVYPVSVRATAHGLSAASGKLGALVPSVLYSYISTRTQFWVVCWFGFAGWIVTQIFVPDTTGLDLREQDRYWTFVRAGKAGDYHGIAVHPRHISLWEKFILKRHLAYDPELDRIARINEMRDAHLEKTMIKESGKAGEAEEDDHSILSPSASQYFLNEKTRL